MRKLILITAGLALFCGTAQAITFHHARVALRTYVLRDHPTSYRINGCRRDSRKQISCNIVERGVKTLWTADGQPIIMTFSYRTTATRVKHGIRLTSPVFVPVTIR